jgi:hypothetical protein
MAPRPTSGGHPLAERQTPGLLLIYFAECHGKATGAQTGYGDRRHVDLQHGHRHEPHDRIGQWHRRGNEVAGGRHRGGLERLVFIDPQKFAAVNGIWHL